MIVGICMVRDEADVIGATLRHHLTHGVDHIIVADNLSTDATDTILREVALDTDRVTVLEDREPGYYQDEKMSALAVQAYEMGATWVLPFDADELFYPEAGGTLAEFFSGCRDDVVTAYGWDHIATRNDAAGPTPFHRIQHRRPTKQPLPKVAFRACPGPSIAMGNHGVDRHAPSLKGGGLTYRHFQYRSLDQMTRKVRNGCEAYDATDLHAQFGAHWRALGVKTDAELAADWRALLDEPGLIHDPAPVLP